MARKFRKAQIDDPMQLPDAIAEILLQAHAQADQLAQIVGGDIGERRGGRMLLMSKARDTEGIDGVGLRTGQLFGGEPRRPQRVEEGDGKALRAQRGEEILPIVARGLHGDQGLLGRPEHAEQLGVAIGVLAEPHGGVERPSLVVHDGRDMALGADVDPHESHTRRPFPREDAGASEPVPMLVLVHARTSATPRDTVRALDTGRGRRPQNRGQSLNRPAATLSRIPLTFTYTATQR